MQFFRNYSLPERLFWVEFMKLNLDSLHTVSPPPPPFTFFLVEWIHLFTLRPLFFLFYLIRPFLSDNLPGAKRDDFIFV